MSNVETKKPSAAERGFDDYFGVCPHCHKSDGFVNIGKEHWFFCHEHKTMWFVGSNLFDSWKHETEEGQWAEYARLGLAQYYRIENSFPLDD